MDSRGSQSKGERISGRFVAVLVVVADAVGFGVAVPFGTTVLGFATGAPEGVVVALAVVVVAGASVAAPAGVAAAVLVLVADTGGGVAPSVASPDPLDDPRPPNDTASTAPIASIAAAPITSGHFFEGGC